jgi:hypothetical protein
MAKTVPCNVVSSVFLTRGSDIFLHVRHPNNENHRPDDVIPVEVRIRHARDSVVWPGRFSRSRAAFDYHARGQFLDCYV